MHSTLWRLTHGAAGLVIAYLSVLIPMYVGLIKRKAPVAKLVVAPLVAIASYIVSVIAVAMESAVIGAVGLPNDGVFQIFIGWVITVAIGYASACNAGLH
jgi:hypothetical protein